MSNGISTLWQGIVDELNDNKDDLGIGVPGAIDDPEDDGVPGAERASTGKVTTLMPPSAAVWLVPGQPTLVSQKGNVRIPLDVFIYCIAAPTNTEADAVDAALTIAGNILSYLTNKEIEGTVLTQPDNDPPLEIVERSSTGAIAGVLLKAEVTL
jgi:hypothetical protein